MDNACALGSLEACFEGPCTAFLFACGEEGAEAQDFVTLADHSVQAGFLEAQVLQEFNLVGRFHLGKFFFDLAADHDYFVTVLCCVFLKGFYVGVAGKDVVFLDVGAVEQGLCGKECEVLDDLVHFFAFAYEAACSLAFLECVAELFASCQACLSFGTTHTGVLCFGGQTLFDGFQILEDKFGFDDIYVADRVHRAMHVNDVAVVEATDHFHNGLAFADVGEELVAKAFALGSTLNEACDVHEFGNGGNDGLGIVNLDQFVQTSIRNVHHTHVGVDGAEGIVSGFGACVGDCVKDGALTDVGQAYDTTFKTHDNLRLIRRTFRPVIFLRCKVSKKGLSARPLKFYFTRPIMANAKNMDLLNGSIWDKILKFAIPLAASSIFQQLFNSADVAVVGKFAGDAALAAVGANTFIINLMVNLFVGLSIGANVVVANALGERSARAVSRGVHTAIAVSIVCGILLSVVGIVFARSILSAISTPSDILDDAVLYFRIYFVGMPFIMLYNFCAAILRSKGDTKRPFYVLLVSGAINLVLNIIFVVGFHMDVDGVAIATVIANVLSSFAVLYFLMHEVGPFKFEFWKLRVTPFILSRIIKIGLPAGVQGALFSFSNVCIQSAINSLGSTAVAASAVAMNPELIVYFWLASFGHACVTFVGQNYGARNLERCRKVVRWTLFLSGLSTFALGALTCIFYHPILSIFTNDESVIATGAYRVFIVIGLEFINVMIDVTSGALRGMGKSMVPTLICVFGICGVRISWVFFMFPKFGTFKALMLCYPISWLTAGTILVCVYMAFVRKTRIEWAKES